MKLKQHLSILGLTICLAACGSGVPLNNVPVEDKTAIPVKPGTGDEGSGATARNVTQVNLEPTGTALPGPNVARVIYFDYDSYIIKPEFQAIVEAHARYLNADKARKVVIGGHTDERGGREYNLALGQKRAEAVRRALGLLGVADAQVEAVSFGKEKPAAGGSDEEAWAKNRRAEFRYL